MQKALSVEVGEAANYKATHLSYFTTKSCLYLVRKGRWMGVKPLPICEVELEPNLGGGGGAGRAGCGWGNDKEVMACLCESLLVRSAAAAVL